VAERSAFDTLGVAVIGAGLGVGAALLVSWLKPSTRAEVAPPPSPPPPSPPPPSAEPPRPPMPPSPPSKKDEKRLTFLMTQPESSAGALPMRFQLEGASARTYSIKELIDRVKSGGRSDVTLRATGMRPGSIHYARAFLMKSGIDVWDGDGKQWKLGPDASRVKLSDDPDLAQWQQGPDDKATVVISGNMRGRYGSSSFGRGHYR
jgi:hypothetical protein